MISGVSRVLETLELSILAHRFLRSGLQLCGVLRRSPNAPTGNRLRMFSQGCRAALGEKLRHFVGCFHCKCRVRLWEVSGGDLLGKARVFQLQYEELGYINIYKGGYSNKLLTLSFFSLMFLRFLKCTNYFQFIL